MMLAAATSGIVEYHSTNMPKGCRLVPADSNKCQNCQVRQQPHLAWEDCAKQVTLVGNYAGTAQKQTLIKSVTVNSGVPARADRCSRSGVKLLANKRIEVRAEATWQPELASSGLERRWVQILQVVFETRNQDRLPFQARSEKLNDHTQVLVFASNSTKAPRST